MPNRLFGWLFASPLHQHMESRRQQDRLSQTCLEVEQALHRLYSENSLKIDTETSFGEFLRQRKNEDARLEKELSQEQNRNCMRQDILDLHQRLGSGLASEELERLHRALEAHFVADSHLLQVEGKIDRCVLEFLFSKVGAAAWEEYRCLSTAKLESDLRLENVFLKMTPLATRDLMLGIVAIWKHAYPERGGVLWAETVTLGVCAGLRARIFVRAMELWFRLDRELESQMVATLEKTLTDLRVAGSGLNGVYRVTSEVDDACRQIIPEMVWNHLGPALHKEAEPENTVIDPVCWMRVTREGARAHASHAGKDYYFCHPECQRKFLEKPAEYLPTAYLG